MLAVGVPFMADVKKLAPLLIHGFFFSPPIESNFIGHIVAEIWKDKIYEPYLQGKKDLIILDIGANIGFTSYYFSPFAKQVYALEPSKQHFDILTHMLSFNNIINVKPIQKALYIENGKFPFGGPKNNTTMRSLHTATWNEGKPDEEVEAITFDKLFEDEKIEKVDLLKLDIEGTEIEVFSSEGFKEVADKIDFIIVEQHDWSGRNPNQLKEALKNNGFSFEVLPNDAQIFVAKRI